MNAEILSVGTELLLGNIVNTNAAFLSQQLAGLGIAVYSQSTVGDNAERLLLQLEHSFQKSDIIIISGGLGPTQDDITKDVAAKYFGKELIMHDESLERIKIRFAGKPLPENVSRNALVPDGAKILPNDNGSAPGVVIEKGGKMLMMLPGPPHEMKPMFIDYAIPFLRSKTDRTFLSQTIKIIGLGESKVETMLKDLIDAQTNPTIAPYAKVGEVHVRLTASAADETAAKKLISPISEEIHKRLYPNVFTDDENKELAEVVLDLLKSKNHTLATAESCTGGLIASSLVDISGCSNVFNEGLITYTNDSKINRLGIDKNLVEIYGAVSSQVAAAMAEGAAKTCGTTVGVATTGIAGPEGGTPEKPVGLVYVGLHIKTVCTITHEFKLSGNRNEVRTRAAKLALEMLRREL